MKKSLFSLISMAGLFALTACNSSDDIAGNDTGTKQGELKVVAGIATRAYDNMWSAGDEIGLYTVKADGTLAGTGNLEYKSTLADGDNTSSDFAPVGTAAVLPNDGSSVNVVTYYPYSASTADGKCAFDLTNQTSQPAIDLMAAKAEGISVANSTAVMNFTHKFSKVYMTVTAEEGVSTDGLTATIAGLKTAATYDILNDQITAGDATADISMKVSGNVIEAIVLPTDAAADHNLKLTIGSTVYKAAINTQFEEGKKYTYNVKFTAAGNVEITGSGITNWVDVPGSEVVVTPGEDTGFAYPNVYVFGSATPGGWSMGSLTQLTKTGDDTYTVEVALTAGEFKFPLNNDWGCDWIMPMEADASITSTACQLVKDGAAFDYKWVVKEAEAGTYNIVLNVKDMTMTAYKVEPTE